MVVGIYRVNTIDDNKSQHLKRKLFKNICEDVCILFTNHFF